MQNPIDYRKIWISYLVVLNSNVEQREQLVQSLNSEIHYAFDVVTRISMEEVESKIGSSETYQTSKEIVESQIAFSVFSGYILGLLIIGIEPTEIDLKNREETKDVGKVWIQSHKSDNTKNLLKRIDFVASLMIEKSTSGRINQLLLNSPDFNTIMYKDLAIIETFLNWAGHQGYILSLLESDLIDGK